jgi:hypothetical protein
MRCADQGKEAENTRGADNEVPLVASVTKDLRRSSIRKPSSDEVPLPVHINSAHTEPMPQVLQFQKTAETLARLAEAVAANPLFVHLEEEQRQTVFEAMFEYPCTGGQTVLRQGDGGDLFFVVESGVYQAWKVRLL